MCWHGNFVQICITGMLYIWPGLLKEYKHLLGERILFNNEVAIATNKIRCRVRPQTIIAIGTCRCHVWPQIGYCHQLNWLGLGVFFEREHFSSHRTKEMSRGSYLITPSHQLINRSH